VLRSGAIERVPTTDYEGFRTQVVRHAVTRAALALGLVAVAAAAVLNARKLDPQQSGFVPRGSSAIVVLDLSESITPSIYHRVGAVLRDISNAQEPVGLIVFSDAAYELLPPGSPPQHLRPLLRYFTPVGGSGFEARFRNNPWARVFGGGTLGGTGLELAQRVLRRDRIKNGSVLFVSDLEVADIGDVTRTLDRLRAEDVSIRIVPLFPNEQNRLLFERLAGREAFLDAGKLPDAAGRRSATLSTPVSPGSVVLLTVLLLVGLAVNEHWCARLGSLRRRDAGERA
jgi:hypothetical protein